MEFIDDYDHKDQNIIYTTENIPTDETNEDFDSQFCHYCTCDTFCTVENKCQCIEKFGYGYIAESKRHNEEYVWLKYVLNETIDFPIYECNNNCSCKGKDCRNRLVQYGPRKHLKIVDCETTSETTQSEVSRKKSENANLKPINSSKGFGLITLTSIKKGEFVCEYAGEIISKSEALLRFKKNKEDNSMNYIICVKEHSGDNSIVTYIDPKYFGNIGRYLNHSCEPNCKLVPIRVNNSVPKLCIFTRIEVNENSELTFDYSDGDSEIITNENAIRLGLKECLCQTKNCRKWLPFSPHLVE